MDGRTGITHLSEPIVTRSSLTLDAMESLACTLALKLESGDTVTLQGELGVGKTAFARALIRAIAVDSAVMVNSPTFTLMQPYDVVTKQGMPETLWHIDLYRLEDAGGLPALGLDELWSHIVLLEWPRVAQPVLPAGHLSIGFEFGARPETRTLAFSGNEAWRDRLGRLT